MHSMVSHGASARASSANFADSAFSPRSAWAAPRTARMNGLRGSRLSAGQRLAGRGDPQLAGSAAAR